MAQESLYLSGAGSNPDRPTTYTNPKEIDMLIPSPTHIIVEVTEEVFKQHTDKEMREKIILPVFTGKVYAVGDTLFSESPVMGDGRSFSWARKPEEFPLTNGEEVVCQYWEHATKHEGKCLFFVLKNNILGVYRDRNEVEATLFDNYQEPTVVG